MPKRIILFRDFKEDHRISMDVYADNLFVASQMAKHPFEFQEYQPEIKRWLRYLPEIANTRMRLVRYIGYPHQARLQEGDVFHILDHAYAHLLRILDPTKTVITVHDIIPLLWGRGLINGVKASKRRRLCEWSFGHFKQAQHIISISENTKSDLINYCHCRADQISVIHYGIDNHFKPLPESKNELRLGLGLPGDGLKLILITGNIFYKNQQTSLSVFEKLCQRYKSSIRLVRLGGHDPEWERVLKNSAVKDQVIQLSNLKHDQMPRLYNAVDCLLFPSWYEGFGRPPLEAMACGTPAVTSNIAALLEVVGEAALTASPNDVDGLSEAIIQLFEDKNFLYKKIRQGIKHASGFTWEKNIRKTMEIYKMILKEKT